ncbi:MAG: hypothetical protein ACXVYB_00025 [Arthrobacter sp.]
MTDTELDLELSEELDFPIPCGHSRHGDGGLWHGGDAEFVAVSLHNCQAQPGKPPPYFYPCCARWAEYVTRCTANSLTIQCSRCGTTGYWEHMVQIVSTL